MRLDQIFVNGNVFDGYRHRRNLAVGVRDGQIVVVADPEQVRELAVPATKVTDLAGGLLLPGFTDGHVHPTQAGMERTQCNLADATGRGKAVRMVKEYADEHPDVEWTIGGGWSLAHFRGGVPTAAELDSVVPDRPVFITNRDHHGSWVNSKAMELAGIDRHTPDPPHGRIERDAEGNPTGTLQEIAMALVVRVLPAKSHPEKVTALLDAQAFLHSLGITGWQDAILGDYANMSDASDAYLQLVLEGRLTARVVGALWWEHGRGLEQVPELVERRRRLRHGRFRATSVKIMQDGIPENFSAGMLE